MAADAGIASRLFWVAIGPASLHQQSDADRDGGEHDGDDHAIHADSVPPAGARPPVRSAPGTSRFPRARSTGNLPAANEKSPLARAFLTSTHDDAPGAPVEGRL